MTDKLIFKQFAFGYVQAAGFFLVRLVTADLDGLSVAAVAVAKGELICYPTDTVYGLGCDPLNASAVKKVMSAKGRGRSAMPVLVHSTEDAEKIVIFSNAANKLATAFWPGPLSLVLSAREIVPAMLALNETLAVRCPKHAICQQLLALCNGMLLGTSANITGKPPALTANDAIAQLGDRVNVILDGGRSPLGVASTVVDLTRRPLRVVREGPISRAEILRVLKASR